MKTKNKSIWLRFDRVLAHDLLKQAVILVCLFVALFAVSYVLLSLSNSDWRLFCEEKNLSKWLLPLYLLIDTNALNTLYMDGGVHGWMLFASSLTYLAGLFVFNGMIISVMTNAISLRVERHNDGLIHYLKSGHYIIMGYDDTCPSIIDYVFAKDPEAYVLILTSAKAREIKEDLKKTLGRQQLNRVIINYGHRMSKEEYAPIHLEAAEEIYIVGNRTMPAHDAVNVECVDNICSYLNESGTEQRPGRITCVFEDLDTYAAFKTSEIFDKVRKLGIEFIPYNFYAGWANQVFVKQYHRNRLQPGKRIPYPTVYGNGITTDDDRYVHLVFVGTTYFSVAFAIEAAHVLHFPNFNRKKSLRTRITFIDRNADKERHIFKTRNSHFFDVQSLIYRNIDNENDPDTNLKSKGFLDTEFEFVKGDIFSDKVREELRMWAEDKNQHLSIFLALANQRDNFAIGMNMPDEVYDNEVPVFIRQDRSDNFVTNLRETDAGLELDYYNIDNADSVKRKGRYAHIYPFGMNDTGYSTNDKMMRAAKLINYLYTTADYSNNEFVDLLVLNSIPKKTIEKAADEEWRKLPVAKKWSNLYAAYSFTCKLATLRAMRGLDVDDRSMDKAELTAKEINTLAEVEHNRWNVEKLLMGFRKPKPGEDKYIHPQHADKLKKNKELFIHHDIRPYGELPENIKQLDREFSEYIPWILKMVLG